MRAMKEIVDSLQLTFGQVAWALNAGREPDKVTIDRLRYLRQLHVPFTDKELKQHGAGSGNRLIYGFDHLVECALAIYALRQRMKPTEVAKVIVAERVFIRNAARELFLSLSPEALTASWVKSRGQEKVLMEDEQFLRLHDRFSQTPGKIDLVSWEQAQGNPDISPLDFIERLANGEARPLVPLRRVTLIAVAWALEAPKTRPGPQ